MQRIQKLIAEAGICSRRKAEELIKNKKVRVNGAIAEIGQNADYTDEIIVNGEVLRPEKKVYFMLNKPKGYITTASDPYGRKHVLELLHENQRLFPVGRLDRDTTGLLLLTNDGEFANKITHPRYQVKKTYIVILDRKIRKEDASMINNGVIIDGKKVTVKLSMLLGKRVKITLHTGINKVVKRIFKKFGYWVKDLKRTEIQGVKLNVKEGKYRHLVQSEIKKLSTSPKNF